MAAAYAWVVAHMTVILSVVGLIVNEILAANPNFASNSIVQLILGVLGLGPKATTPALK